MLRHAAADVMASDHDWALVPKRIQELHQPGGEARDRSLAQREFTSGAAEAGEIDRHWAKARRGDTVKDGLPDAAPIGAMKQQHQGTILAGGQIADRNAPYIDSLASRHRTILFTWSSPSPTAS
jgi:hypothetical protein